ncbi:hypothetical protein [Neisseria sp.]|uniref:hypothetical protein n=1 Tax=Neisseria sp. TaxID=192066 RepID=UPI0026DCA03F|nr:hypothetical protein [Neisseria sp.]
MLPLFTLTACSSHAKELPLKQVQEKLSRDEKALAHFLYLGKLHCLDSQLYSYPADVFQEGSFNRAHQGLFNMHSNTTRLLRGDKLAAVFTRFERANLPEVKGDDDAVLACSSLYHSEKGKKLYLETIGNKANYMDGNPKDHVVYYNELDKEEVHQNLLDYLKYGQIDVRRLVDGCTTYNCR